ncbi:MAG TPA: ABC transporter substrate-binding protein [Caldimonas sp.]|nr:ABC transporter substrate-binding protein [Caldimonas sp.]
MDRRAFIGVASSLLVAATAARAQQVGKFYRIGILWTVPAAQDATNLDALRKGLRDLGYVEGRNLLIEYRSADGHAEQFPELASELVRLKVDLIVTRGTPAAIAAKAATRTIPVVTATMGQPLAVVASLAHPGGNVTGQTTFSTALTGKRIQLLKELVPSISRVRSFRIWAIRSARRNGKRPGRRRAPRASRPSFSTCAPKAIWAAHSKRPPDIASMGFSSGSTVSPR